MIAYQKQVQQQRPKIWFRTADQFGTQSAAREVDARLAQEKYKRCAPMIDFTLGPRTHKSIYQDIRAKVYKKLAALQAKREAIRRHK